MNYPHLLKRAILSEKSYDLMDHGRYTFLVTKGASKNQIKKAVEGQFQVNVVSVNVLTKSAKTKRIARTRKTTNIGSGKKAVVTLQKGQSIALISTKSEKSNAKKTESKVEGKETKPQKGRGILAKFRRSNAEKEKE